MKSVLSNSVWRLVIGLWLGLASLGWSQEEAANSLALKAQVVEDDEVEANPTKEVVETIRVAPIQATLRTQSEARTLTLSIPAPRGQIVDRNGVPLAQTRVANYLALSFPFIENATNEKVLAFAWQQISKANETLGKQWTMEEARLLAHYESRRWIPLVFSTEDGLNVELSSEDLDKIKPLLGQGLATQSAYIRYYPKGDSACHVIGYVRKVRALPTGPIADEDPVFEELEGVEGLEATFDRDLSGTPGKVNMLFSADGKVLSEEVLRRPVPGRNVVTTLDYNIQRYAENALKKGARNGGSFVIMDVKTGDVLALASNPGFDLNLWVPGIKAEQFRELNANPRKPLYPRATFGQYPPASTFKIVTVLGAMESGKVTPKTAYNCGASLLIGDRYFHNHTRSGEGMMNAITAIKRSCNTWMYQAALAVGADPITNMAIRLGFGEKTGIPIKAEAAGTVPTNVRKMEQRGIKLSSGELANISIGQGEVLATPLQVCQSMSALADGANLTQPRLVRQIQDVNDKVVMATEVQVRRKIDLNPEHREAVVKGMVAVVSGSGGTGKAASIKHAQVAGKTGTAQWNIAKNQNLAWFTGFLPANNPVYSFAVLYEGRPGESVSGGKLAAPMVREVFNNVFEKASPDDPLVLAMKDTAVSVEVDEGGSDLTDDEATPQPSSRPVEEVKPAEVTEKPKGARGFLRKLFGR